MLPSTIANPPLRSFTRAPVEPGDLIREVGFVTDEKDVAATRGKGERIERPPVQLLGTWL